MLLSESCFPAAPTVRTIRLSTSSFLNATLTENDVPLFSVETNEAMTTLRRHGKEPGDSKSSSLTDIASVHWSCAESSESSSVESPTLAGRFFRAGAAAFGNKEPKEKDGVLVEISGRQWAMSELLRLSGSGGSRKFSLHGKSFKWKHINGIWQCFYASKMIALFEPSITTAPARIRIFPITSISITRRVLDMIVLTCMLLVTNPKEWWSHTAEALRKISSTRQPISRHRSLRRTATSTSLFQESGGNSNVSGPVLRRAQSHSGLRMNAPSYDSIATPMSTPSPVFHTQIPCNSPRSGVSTSNGWAPHTPTSPPYHSPIIGGPFLASPVNRPVEMHTSPPHASPTGQTVRRTASLSNTRHPPQDRPSMRTKTSLRTIHDQETRTLRRTSSQGDLLVSPTQRAQQQYWETNLVRGGSVPSLPHLSSSRSNASVDRHTSFLPPRLAEAFPLSSVDSAFGPPGPGSRLWERPNAYGPPGTVQPSCPPPAYSPRDASSLSRSPLRINTEAAALGISRQRSALTAATKHSL